MDKLITLKGRNITPPSGDSVDYSETFDPGSEEWAAVQTMSRGPILFDRTNIARQITHLFMIRYRDDVTSEVWVEYENVNYDILSAENLEQRNEYLFLYCVIRGIKTLPINQV